MDVTIVKIDSDKKRFLDLLLLGDEQESMVDKYLDKGEMFALYSTSQSVVSTAVITHIDEACVELKNIAVAPPFQRRGYGRRMIEFICERYAKTYRWLLVGTGDSPSTTSFYRSCRFTYSHSVKDFFTDNYDHPIYENGVLLRDMLYFRRDLRP